MKKFSTLNFILAVVLTAAVYHFVILPRELARLAEVEKQLARLQKQAQQPTPVSGIVNEPIPSVVAQEESPVSIQGLLDQADTALAEAKGAKVEQVFLAKVEEAKKLAKQVGGLTKGDKKGEAYKAAKAIFSEAKRLKEQHEEQKVALQKQQEAQKKNQGPKDAPAKTVVSVSTTPTPYQLPNGKMYEEAKGYTALLVAQGEEEETKTQKKQEELAAQQKTLYEDTIAEYKGETTEKRQSKVVVKASSKKDPAPQQEKEKGTAEEKTASEVLKKATEGSTPQDKAHQAMMTYSGSIKGGFRFCKTFEQFLQAGLAVEAKLAESLTFEAEAMVVERDFFGLMGEEEQNFALWTKKLCLTWESQSIPTLWATVGMFESPLFKNPIGGNLFHFFPQGILGGYTYVPNEGAYAPFEQFTFVGGFVQDLKLGSSFLGEVSTQCTLEDGVGVQGALTLFCSDRGFRFNPRAVTNFTVDGRPVVASVEMLLAVGGNEPPIALRMGFRVGEVDSSGQPVHVGGWMFEFVSTWRLPDLCHLFGKTTHTTTIGMRVMDWLVVSASATVEQGGDSMLGLRVAASVTAQPTQKLRTTVTVELAGVNPGIKATASYDVSELVGIRREEPGFFKSATVQVGAFMGAETSGGEVALEVKF